MIIYDNIGNYNGNNDKNKYKSLVWLPKGNHLQHTVLDHWRCLCLALPGAG